MSNDDSLSCEVHNHEPCFLHVLAILEYDLDLFCDGSILIWSSIDIMDWDWVWQWVSSLCFWMKAWLMNIPVVPESRRVEVETDCREVVVWSSMAMLRVWADLDRTYMDGGGTAAGVRGTGFWLFLGVSFFSDVPHMGCDLAGYLQQE